ncbi:MULTISPECIES: hypothetical protein [unclassified Microcoleus]|uniref:hypothetical protein n=1 Tax=unclassified Microcoleus TaxID=2642155 RepID=UPI002FD0DC7A
MNSRSSFTLTLSLISAIVTAIAPGVFAQQLQLPANATYIDKNCNLNQQLAPLERYTIFSREEFTTNRKKYWFYAARYQDGASLFCISERIFIRPQVLNVEKIQRQFIDKVVRDPKNPTGFIITVRGGNGPGATTTNYRLDLSNVDRPKLTPLSVPK